MDFERFKTIVGNTAMDRLEVDYLQTLNLSNKQMSIRLKKSIWKIKRAKRKIKK